MLGASGWIVRNASYADHYFKMKVGSADPEDDIMRARAIREEIGPDNVLMMDANQKWDVNVSAHTPNATASLPSVPCHVRI
jgi:L-alanine-DL-glutamate epimerase-like enolase superfamily enzyme